MHVLKLTSVVCCAVICFQLSTVSAWKGGRKPPGKRERVPLKPQGKREQVPLKPHRVVPAETGQEIEDLQYTREETDDPVIGGEIQLTDKFEFQVPSSSDTKTPVSLLLFDSEERVWVEASVKKEEKQTCYKGNGCQKTITLSKPLIGYDLLKPSGCGGGEFKQQPFTKRRWGYVTETDSRPQCYMVTASINGQSVSQMYPDNCAEKEASIYKKENYQLIYETAKEQAYSRSQRFKRTVINSMTQFKIHKIGNMRKFVCKVAYTHMGYSTSLGNEIPDADVKAYYRPNNSVPWGNHLLDLEWAQFAGGVNGVNKFVSWVSRQHLNNQGVSLNKCFKCEVTINDVVTTRCRGGCTCN